MSIEHVKNQLHLVLKHLLLYKMNRIRKDNKFSSCATTKIKYWLLTVYTTEYYTASSTKIIFLTWWSLFVQMVLTTKMQLCESCRGNNIIIQMTLTKDVNSEVDWRIRTSMMVSRSSKPLHQGHENTLQFQDEEYYKMLEDQITLKIKIEISISSKYLCLVPSPIWAIL